MQLPPVFLIYVAAFGCFIEKSKKKEFAGMLKKRTKKYVVDNIKFFRPLSNSEEAKVMGRQLLLFSSSVGAN